MTKADISCLLSELVFGTIFHLPDNVFLMLMMMVPPSIHSVSNAAHTHQSSVESTIAFVDYAP